MTDELSPVLTARWILPVTSPPIEGGWVRIEAGRVVEVGKRDCPAGAKDLGDVALLPGLVNAHTHLEFSDFTEPIGHPGVPLSQWIGMVIAARQTTEPQKRSAIESGLRELRSGGTVLAGEIATPPCDYPPSTTKIVPFAEVLGLEKARGEERFSETRACMEREPDWAISPHAPYSTPPELIRQCVRLARTHNRPLAMHVAESPAERELLNDGTGPFADSLKAIGVWHHGLFPWGRDPIVSLLQTLAEAPRALIVHGNDLRDAEIETMVRYPNLTVVYCPRTHHFFRYEPHPVDKLIAAGVPVALGTDSRASNPDLNLWREVQHLLRHRGDLNPDAVLQMATVAGARALGHANIGKMEPQSDARFGTVLSGATNVEELYADLAENDYLPF